MQYQVSFASTLNWMLGSLIRDDTLIYQAPKYKVIVTINILLDQYISTHNIQQALWYETAKIDVYRESNFL